MGRIFVFLGLLALAVAIAMVLLSIWRGVQVLAQDMARPIAQFGKGGRMAPNGIQKVAYGALLVLLFGLGTGLIGGL